MFSSRSIVNPIVCDVKYFPGSVAIMTATEADFILMNRISPARFVTKRKLYTSCVNIYELHNGLRYSIIGPFVGAPYAAMLFETLLVWGVTQLIFVGWCGSISVKIEIGDIIIPDASIIDEGTSKHYVDYNEFSLSKSSPNLGRRIKELLNKNGITFKNGLVWTTDGVFRETVDKVEKFKNKGALAVEMELSAIFSIAKFRGIEAAGILIVSDMLRGSKWSPGFKNKSFKKARNLVCRTLNDLCYELI